MLGEVVGLLLIVIGVTLVAVTGGFVLRDGVAAQVLTRSPTVRDARPSRPRGSLKPAVVVLTLARMR